MLRLGQTHEFSFTGTINNDADKAGNEMVVGINYNDIISDVIIAT